MSNIDFRPVVILAIIGLFCSLFGGPLLLIWIVAWIYNHVSISIS